MQGIERLRKKSCADFTDSSENEAKETGDTCKFVKKIRGGCHAFQD